MFCSNCGTEYNLEANKYCSNCGRDLHSNVKPNGLFGRVGDIKNFVDFKTSTSKGRPSKAELGKLKGKKVIKEDPEVVIKIGLMTWDENDEILKEKRAKRVAIKVPTTANYKTLLIKSKEKWQYFWPNLFDKEKEYTLLLESGQEATFLPGPGKEFFQLKRYKEELMRDYKRITLYLCTVEDCYLSEKGTANPIPRSQVNEEDQSSLSTLDTGSGPSGCLPWVPSSNRNKMQDSEAFWFSDSEEEEKPQAKYRKKSPTSNRPSIPYSSQAVETQVRMDEKMALALQNTFDQEDGNIELKIKSSKDMVKALVPQVIRDGKDTVYVVVRRKAPLERNLRLWKRAVAKVSPENILRVKYVGEDGIDTGALAKEFLTEVITSIGEQLFPNGCPVYSTNHVYNGNYKACGELVAVSLSQGGPPPCFLDEKVYHTLVTGCDLDLTSPSLEEHLSSSERELINEIKEDVSKYQETVIDHGYTGSITQVNVQEILASVIVSILSRRTVCLKEFSKGLKLYGLFDLICQHSQVAKELFFNEKQEDVDANYLISLLKPQFSEEGSSRRVVEETMMDYFQDFVMRCEDEEVFSHSDTMAWECASCEDKDQSDEDSNDITVEIAKQPDTLQITPACILGWLTGAKHREISGEDASITVKFDHDCLKRKPMHTLCFPVVSACSRTITFPVQHMNTESNFADILHLGFSNSQAFGMT